MKQIPNLFTLLNLIFGCIAIVFTLQNGIVIQYNEGMPEFVPVAEKLWMASLFIGLAAVVDFLDGFVARLFKAESEMGAQLDSLADVVSFGVAPSMIMYQFLRLAYAGDIDGVNTSMIWLVPAFLIAGAGAYRLARFNLDKSQAYGFKGVPIPAAGLLIASLPLIYWHAQSEYVRHILENKWFLYALILVVSYLMVSTLPLIALKIKPGGVKANMPALILVALALVFILLLGWLSVPAIFLVYIILSLALKNQHP